MMMAAQIGFAVLVWNDVRPLRRSAARRAARSTGRIAASDRGAKRPRVTEVMEAAGVEPYVGSLESVTYRKDEALIPPIPPQTPLSGTKQVHRPGLGWRTHVDAGWLPRPLRHFLMSGLDS
jgi:hypothetical protein